MTWSMNFGKTSAMAQMAREYRDSDIVVIMPHRYDRDNVYSWLLERDEQVANNYSNTSLAIRDMTDEEIKWMKDEIERLDEGEDVHDESYEIGYVSFCMRGDLDTFPGCIVLYSENSFNESQLSEFLRLFLEKTGR